MNKFDKVIIGMDKEEIYNLILKIEKLKRTFRLSEQAVEAIENRNRKLYPTATDFLEAKILAPADNSTEMLHKISAQLREMESLLVQQYHKKIEEEQPFH